MKFTLTGIPLALLLAAGLSFGSPAPASTAFGVSISFTPASPLPGQPVTFSATAVGGVGGLTYQWILSDGTTTAFLPENVQLVHPFSAAAHINVRVNVEDTTGARVFDTKSLTVHNPSTATKPTNSSTIILDSTNNRVWCVNPDQDTVTAIDTTTNTVVFEKPVGKNPRTLAQAADGTIWVVSQQYPSVSLLDPVTGALKNVITLAHGSLPYGICMTPDGTAAYVSFQGVGGVAKYDTASLALLATSTVPASARGISVTGDGRVFVTRFISPQSDPLLSWNSNAFIANNHGEVAELNSGLGLVRMIQMQMDPGFAGAADPDFGPNVPPGTSNSRGVPNYLTSMVISPDGLRAWVPSKKDNIQRGTKTPERDGRTPGAETTYRAIVSSIDLTSSSKLVDQLGERFDVDNSEMPQAACMSPLGDLIFVALQGNNRIQVRDAYDTTNILNGLGNATGILSTEGLAPQGLVLSGNTLYVHNYMSRSVSVMDATAVLASNGRSANLGAPIKVTTIAGPELMGANAARGKQVFYNASDPRMSSNGYISCAGCHLDGGSDMRVLDFTNRGEGFRNTIVLQGRGGTGMGNVHWSANFNEIQDFDNDVYYRFHDGNPNPPNGLGSSFTASALAPFAPFAPLDPVNNNAGKDPSAGKDLDRLADYVASLTKVSRSPFRNADGTLSPQGAAGEATFTARNCQKCHSGRNFTDSQVGTGTPAVDVFPPPGGSIILHNVGTLKPTSGGRLGGALPGIDTPTLKGLWQSAPYFHDGHAATLMDVLNDASAPTHFGGAPLTQQEKDDLVRYMLEIDEFDAPPVSQGAPVPKITVDSVSTGKPYSIVPISGSSFPFIDRSYQFNGSPANSPAIFTLIRTAEDDKNVTADNHLTITVPASAFIFILYDTRGTDPGNTPPTWLTANWTNISVLQTYVGLSTTSTFWRRQMPAAPASQSVTLGGNLATGAVGALRNYFVIVADVSGVVFNEGPLSANDWAHDHDGDGDGLRDAFEVANLSSPWLVATGGAGVPDEDIVTATGKTAFTDQLTFVDPNPQPPAPPASGGGGGGGGCGFTGLEPILAWAAVRLLKNRRRSRS